MSHALLLATIALCACDDHPHEELWTKCDDHRNEESCREWDKHAREAQDRADERELETQRKRSVELGEEVVRLEKAVAAEPDARARAELQTRLNATRAELSAITGPASSKSEGAKGP